MERKMNDQEFLDPNYHEGENGSIGGNVLHKHDKLTGYQTKNPLAQDKYMKNEDRDAKERDQNVRKAEAKDRKVRRAPSKTFLL